MAADAPAFMEYGKISVSLDRETRQAIDAAANAHRLSRSAMIRILVHRSLTIEENGGREPWWGSA